MYVGKKSIKKLVYIRKTNRFKRLLSLMIIGGIVGSLFYFCRFSYNEYAAARANIVLSFPQIAQSEYPDGSRFSYYDLISEENLQMALDTMHKKGKYMNFTVNDIKNNFYIYTTMKGSASSMVSSERSEGNDYSYVANEYKITFIQPHDYEQEDLLHGIVAPDYSSEFLDALVEANRVRIAEDFGGINSFQSLTEIEDTENYDYSEELNIYRTKINTIRSYLKYLINLDSDFVYKEDGLTLNDIENKYEFLIVDRLDGISDFVESSGISKDLNLTANKLNVHIENTTLKYVKQVDRSSNNQYAITNYDQTFTENLINVVQNNEYGLYQARPKTAFDSVVVQKHEADEYVAEYSADINKYNNELNIYNTSLQTPEEYDRLVGKCEALMDDFKEEYASLSVVASKVVKAYYNDKNESFIEARITDRAFISKSLIIKLGAIFAIIAAIVFGVVIIFWAIRDRIKLWRKRRLIKKIKKKTY